MFSSNQIIAGQDSFMAESDKPNQDQEPQNVEEKNNPVEEVEETETEAYENEQAEDTAEEVKEEANAQVVEVEPAEARLLRLRVDFENFRRRSQREKLAEHQRGRREAVVKLLPVFDSVHMGLLTLKEDSAERSGLQAVMNQLLQSFEELGIEKIHCKGEKFDPVRHEAIANMPSDIYEEGRVSEESRTGFQDEIGLLRPSQVLVSSGPGPK